MIIFSSLLAFVVGVYVGKDEEKLQAVKEYIADGFIKVKSLLDKKSK